MKFKKILGEFVVGVFLALGIKSLDDDLDFFPHFKFKKFIFPIIKFPSIHIDDFIKIQPMNLPPGCVFYMDFVKGGKSRTNFDGCIDHGWPNPKLS